MERNEKIEKLNEAINEALRFIDKAEKAIKRLNEHGIQYRASAKEVAAAKRASMDLSRTLTELRKRRENNE